VAFTVHFASGVCMGYGQATATATTVRHALDLVGEFAPSRCGVLPSYWIERDGRYIVEVYDWCDCWFADPPALAWVVAPPGFLPATDPFSAQFLRS